MLQFGPTPKRSPANFRTLGSGIPDPLPVVWSQKNVRTTPTSSDATPLLITKFAKHSPEKSTVYATFLGRLDPGDTSESFSNVTPSAFHPPGFPDMTHEKSDRHKPRGFCQSVEVSYQGWWNKMMAKICWAHIWGGKNWCEMIHLGSSDVFQHKVAPSLYHFWVNLDIQISSNIQFLMHLPSDKQRTNILTSKRQSLKYVLFLLSL